MMESALFWLELNEDRWCHLPQVISFQLAQELPFLFFFFFAVLWDWGRGEEKEGGG